MGSPGSELVARFAALARAATIAASSAEAAALFLRPGFIHGQGSPAGFFAVQCRHGALGFAVIGHGNETKSA